MVIPGHGRLSDEQDVIEYRDMATIVRDRIREYVKRGMTLDQVKAKKPTLDFDGRYGDHTGFWTTAMFIETIYKEMAAKNPPAPPAGTPAEPDPESQPEQERPMRARQVKSVAGPLAAVLSACWRSVPAARYGRNARRKPRRRRRNAAGRPRRRRARRPRRARRRRRARPGRRRPSISPATGCRSSPRTGSGACARRPRATTPACR